MDSGQKNKSEIVQMFDDGYGGMIKIPSIFIDEADGEKILKLLNMVVSYPPTFPLLPNKLGINQRDNLQN